MENKVKEIMSSVFEIQASSINENTSMTGVEKWDSLTHMHFILKLEEAFKIKLEPVEMIQMINYKSILSVLKQRGVQ